MSRISDVSIHDEQLYWDHRFKRNTIKLLPGDFDVVCGPEMLVTVLGSCIAACIRDTKSGVGGMNHFLLPTEKRENINSKWNDYNSAATRYGDLAMEQLINKIVAMGGKRENFEAKIFGGARMFETSTSDIGAKNIEFVTQYLAVEKIKTVSTDMAGNHARKVYYLPDSGEVYLKRITRTNNDTIVIREKEYLKEAKKARTTADISYFNP